MTIGTRNVWTLDTVRNRCTEDGGGCWIWAQAVNSKGYPQASINGKNTRVQRFLFTELLGRELKPRHVVTTACANPLCCSPECVEAISFGDRNRRSYARGDRVVTRESAKRRALIVEQGRTKLDFAKARAIRARSDESKVALAAEFGVSLSAILDVCANRTWRERLFGASVFDLQPGR